MKYALALSVVVWPVCGALLACSTGQQLGVARGDQGGAAGDSPGSATAGSHPNADHAAGSSADGATKRKQDSGAASEKTNSSAGGAGSVANDRTPSDTQIRGGSAAVVATTVTSSAGAPGSTDAEPCPVLEGIDQADCAAQTVAAQAVPANVLILLDKSGGMASAAPDGSPKWSLLTEALLDLIGQDDVLDNPDLALGLMLFPGQDTANGCQGEDCCALPETAVNVDVVRASESVPWIRAVVGETSPGGGPATYAALDEARRYFESGPGATLQGPKYVLLATDGGPACNAGLECGDAECRLALDGLCDQDCCTREGQQLSCVDFVRTQRKLSELESVGIQTYVVGVPANEAYAGWLNGLAVAGGRPRESSSGNETYYDAMTSGGMDALREAIAASTTDLVGSCWIPLQDAPASLNPSLVNVAIDCRLIPQGGNPVVGTAGAGGESHTPKNWVVHESTDTPTVEILGPYCEQIERGVDRIDVVIACPLAD